MTRGTLIHGASILVVVVAITGSASAQPADACAAQSPGGEWQFGGFLDVGFLNSLNSSSNRLFRSRGTTPRVDKLTVNIGGAYVRKKPSRRHAGGIELTAHGGEDAQLIGFSPTAPNIGGANWLRHLGPTNVSYLAPAGSGLTLQAGIFSSFVGYDSLYAKDNPPYTRPWAADFTPYLMLGVNAGYDASDNLTLSGFVLNGYWHLAHANIALAENLGATVVRVKATRPADGLIEFARREGITHVIFG